MPTARLAPIDLPEFGMPDVSPELRRPVVQASRWNQSNRAVRGVWPAYQHFRSLKVEEGRLMVQADEDQARRVVLLGFEARQQLFPGKPAIGEPVSMNGSPYTVIGVMPRDFHYPSADVQFWVTTRFSASIVIGSPGTLL